MKNYLLPFTLSLLIGISASYQVTAEEHDDHHGNTSLSMTLDQGKKWPIDDSLHKGMTEIRALMITNLADIHQNKFTKQQYSRLANTLQTHLNYLFENCALPTAADAQLHILLSGLMQGVFQMNTGSERQQGSILSEKQQGSILVVQALQNYSAYFSDPHWNDFTH